jgi:hypothetical protein
MEKQAARSDQSGQNVVVVIPGYLHNNVPSNGQNRMRSAFYEARSSEYASFFDTAQNPRTIGRHQESPGQQGRLEDPALMKTPSPSISLIT